MTAPLLDPSGAVVAAVLQILNADPALQTLLGRTTDLAIAWGDLDLSVDPLPILAVEDLGEFDSAIVGARTVPFHIAAFATGQTADTVTGQMLGRVEAALTTPAFTALAVDAGVDPTSQPFARDRVVIRDPSTPDIVQRTIAPAFLITP